MDSEALIDKRVSYDNNSVSLINMKKKESRILLLRLYAFRDSGRSMWAEWENRKKKKKCKSKSLRFISL